MQHRKMHLLLLFALTVFLAAAQPQCDPETQYEKNSACCKMCGPGTRMLSSGTCNEPRCEECGEGEYRDKYTTESKCQRQPYCDPNKNFKEATHVSKKKATICECKQGFHCSTEQCIICVPHTVCPQGTGAKIRGNHTHDTVCEDCTGGTFSNVSSWDSPCKKWTECGNDYHIKEPGTTLSDNICEQNSRTHIIVLVSLAIVAVIAGAVFLCYKVYIKRRHAEGKVKDCFESCWGDKNENVQVEEIPPEEKQMLQEQHESIPEENEEVGYTVNGQPVQQDLTKEEQLSQEESQSTSL